MYLCVYTHYYQYWEYNRTKGIWPPKTAMNTHMTLIWRFYSVLIHLTSSVSVGPRNSQPWLLRATLTASPLPFPRLLLVLFSFQFLKKMQPKRPYQSARHRTAPCGKLVSSRLWNLYSSPTTINYSYSCVKSPHLPTHGSHALTPKMAPSPKIHIRTKQGSPDHCPHTHTAALEKQVLQQVCTTAHHPRHDRGQNQHYTAQILPTQGSTAAQSELPKIQRAGMVSCPHCFPYPHSQNSGMLNSTKKF